MGKKLLLKGIITGAAVGGLLTLFDRDTRNFVNRKCLQSKENISYFVKNPADFVHQINSTYQKCSSQLTNGLSQAMDIMQQLEEITGNKENK
ncbi:YtxH domain-containing protein [Gracilibacillus xinjiangensis]|uniref:YtxH domain-containing protein n=1 Tax=Gracilibacillus xinjiangensis TaxID=1193282 RepID=A0ABV8WRK7_9BACI